MHALLNFPDDGSQLTPAPAEGGDFSYLKTESMAALLSLGYCLVKEEHHMQLWLNTGGPATQLEVFLVQEGYILENIPMPALEHMNIQYSKCISTYMHIHTYI